MNYWGVRSVDPYDLETQSIYQTTLPFSSSTPDQRQAASERFRFLLERIPPLYAEALWWDVMTSHTHLALGKLWGVTQQAVSWRVTRAKSAIKLVGSYGDSWPHPDDVGDIIRETKIRVTRNIYYEGGSTRLHLDREMEDTVEAVSGYMRTWKYGTAREREQYVGQTRSLVMLFSGRWRRARHPLGSIVQDISHWWRPERSIL